MTAPVINGDSGSCGGSGRDDGAAGSSFNSPMIACPSAHYCQTHTVVLMPAAPDAAGVTLPAWAADITDKLVKALDRPAELEDGPDGEDDPDHREHT